jgi:hypothetical protein
MGEEGAFPENLTFDPDDLADSGARRFSPQLVSSIFHTLFRECHLPKVPYVAIADPVVDWQGMCCR